MKKIAVIAAHPDDEVLGCAGTIALHRRHGDDVHVVFMTDGEGARDPKTTRFAQRQSAARNALAQLGVTAVTFLDFADNAMDTLPLLHIVKRLETLLSQLQAHVIYTHFGHDLNIDHRLTYQAVLTACRPQPGQSVRAIYSFEIPSSTEWSPQTAPAFKPNLFVDISPVLPQVTAALACYDQELRPWPHSRSLEAISARQRVRGSQVGLVAAEAFMIEREIKVFPE